MSEEFICHFFIEWVPLVFHQPPNENQLRSRRSHACKQMKQRTKERMERTYEQIKEKERAKPAQLKKPKVDVP